MEVIITINRYRNEKWCQVFQRNLNINEIKLGANERATAEPETPENEHRATLSAATLPFIFQ